MLRPRSNLVSQFKGYLSKPRSFIDFSTNYSKNQSLLYSSLSKTFTNQYNSQTKNQNDSNFLEKSGKTSTLINNRCFSTVDSISDTKDVNSSITDIDSVSNGYKSNNDSSSISKWSEKSLDLLKKFYEQPNHFATVIIKGRPFTVTKRDLVVMDRIKDLKVGDVIKLTQITELGSKDFTIKGSPYINPELVNLQATVVEHPESSLMTIFKKKRRKGYQRTLKHKNQHTLLRVTELEVQKI
ncbi:hypothetical protein BB559_003231 [Furculomyces boomerangus]|uniref:Large ribosomal subunit protein bL21m n=1 Tax=Furculomyces boomerangus TaxID=61424 RepID=A0A2T9YMV7_9FUNG|nr:hypothetical protein BB559_003231 [Furculomyces boomerangus]